ncbi:hypothetical protein [Halorubrum distributum]|uniref:Uncharacterized protein n=1 Tax=Halorubrum distributum JCM 13916 TaxID=1230455 RepID=M0PQ96_9EURY|nr:hypothetical protein [Halorubrum arcis]EMA71714.1 hypothetical protein C462_05313 [Halorubrum arcis JCM 13916]
MKEKAKAYALIAFLGIPLVFHVLFRTCGRTAYGCRRSLLGQFFVAQGGLLAEIVRSTEFLFTGVVGILFVIALIGSARDRLTS